jgi:tetratricopeptide (TPR) repeat protein
MKTYFIHIRKTSGSAVRELLRFNVPKDKICPELSEIELFAKHSREDVLNYLEAFQLYSGHYFTLPKYLPKNTFTFTFLREPLARCISDLNQMFGDSNDLMHDLVKEKSHASAIRIKEVREKLWNTQTHQLVCNAGYNPESLTDAQMLKIASKYLKQLSFVGLQEQFETSLIMLTESLQWDMPKKIRKINTKTTAQGVKIYNGIEFLDDLLELNQLDLQLYADAQKLFDQRVAFRIKNKILPTSKFFDHYAWKELKDGNLNEALRALDSVFQISGDVNYINQLFSHISYLCDIYSDEREALKYWNQALSRSPFNTLDTQKTRAVVFDQVQCSSISHWADFWFDLKDKFSQKVIDPKAGEICVLTYPKLCFSGMNTPACLSGYTPMSKQGYWIEAQDKTSFLLGMTPKALLEAQAHALEKKELQESSEMVFVACGGGAMNKCYHFLMTTIPSLRIYMEIGLTCRIAFPRFMTAMEDSAKALILLVLDLFDIPESRILTCSEMEKFSFKLGILPKNPHSIPWAVDFYRTFLQKLKSEADHTCGDITPLILIYSESDPRRILKNRSEIHAKAIEIGFSLINLDKLSWREKFHVMRNAQLVVGEHGSDLVNILFCSDETHLVEIQTHVGDLEDVYRQLSECCGLRYSVLKTNSLEMEPGMDQSFFLDTSVFEKELKRIIDLWSL